MIRTLALNTALAAALTLMGAPALAVAQDGHAGHGAQAAHHDHHADFQSGRFHVRLSGTEGMPDLILIPGHSSSPHVFDELDAALGSRYRIHALHVQGFAGAPPMDNAEGPVSAPVAEDLARYIRENNIQRPAVIGHSMGGTIGMMLAARHPDLVGRLMVVDMVPFMGAMFSPQNPTVEAVTPIADQIAAGMASSPREAYDAQAAMQINGMINTEAKREAALADMRRTDQRVGAHAFRELIVTDLRPELANITAPTTVLYIRFNDPRMTDEMVDGIYRASFANLPGATLTRIDDSAHFIMYDQPERFLAEVNAFLTD